MYLSNLSLFLFCFRFFFLFQTSFDKTAPNIKRRILKLLRNPHSKMTIKICVAECAQDEVCWLRSVDGKPCLGCGMSDVIALPTNVDYYYYYYYYYCHRHL